MLTLHRIIFMEIRHDKDHFIPLEQNHMMHILLNIELEMQLYVNRKTELTG